MRQLHTADSLLGAKQAESCCFGFPTVARNDPAWSAGTDEATVGASTFAALIFSSVNVHSIVGFWFLTWQRDGG